MPSRPGADLREAYGRRPVRRSGISRPCGPDGIDKGWTRARRTLRPYTDDAERLPASLMEALRRAARRPGLPPGAGAEFVEYLITLKESRWSAS